MSEARCEQCKYYIKLGIPYCYKQKGYKNGVTVYGFCAKDVERLFSFYPVYLPNGGVCKAFQKICERPKCGSEGLIEKSTSKRDRESFAMLGSFAERKAWDYSIS